LSDESFDENVFINSFAALQSKIQNLW